MSDPSSHAPRRDHTPRRDLSPPTSPRRGEAPFQSPLQSPRLSPRGLYSPRGGGEHSFCYYINPVFGKKMSLHDFSGRLIVVKGRVRVTDEDIVKVTQQKQIEAKELRNKLQKEQSVSSTLAVKGKKLENDLQVLKMMMQLEVKQKDRALSSIQGVLEKMAHLCGADNSLQVEMDTLRKEHDKMEAELYQLRTWMKSYDSRESKSKAKNV